MLSARHPSTLRTAFAFLVVPFAIALLCGFTYMLLDGSEFSAFRLAQIVLFISVVYTYPVTLVIGVPVFMLVRSRLQPTLVNCMLGGIFVGIVPVLMVFAYALVFILNRPEYLTSRGAIGIALFASEFAVCGMMAGALFWLFAFMKIGKRPY